LLNKSEEEEHLNLNSCITRIPKGYSEVLYKGKRYSVTRSDFNNGKSLKVFARELGGTGFISFNYYILTTGGALKPCEMPRQKVTDFLKNLEVNV